MAESKSFPIQAVEVLWTECSDGIEVACGELVERLADVVYQTCFSLLQRCEDAQDAAQDALMGLIQRCRSQQTVESPFAYAKAIARNKSVDRLRKRQRRIPTTPLVVDPHAGAIDPLSELQRRERARAVDDFHQQLADSEQQLFTLWWIDGKKQSEIANELELSIHAVKHRIKKLKLIISQKFKNEREG